MFTRFYCTHCGNVVPLRRILSKDWNKRRKKFQRFIMWLIILCKGENWHNIALFELENGQTCEAANSRKLKAKRKQEQMIW